MSDAKRIKDLEEGLEKLQKYVDKIAAQATDGFAKMDKRVKKLEGQGDN